jgi:hypothetical protein
MRHPSSTYETPLVYRLITRVDWSTDFQLYQRPSFNNIGMLQPRLHLYLDSPILVDGQVTLEWNYLGYTNNVMRYGCSPCRDETRTEYIIWLYIVLSSFKRPLVVYLILGRPISIRLCSRAQDSFKTHAHNEFLRHVVLYWPRPSVCECNVPYLHENTTIQKACVYQVIRTTILYYANGLSTVVVYRSSGPLNTRPVSLRGRIIMALPNGLMAFCVHVPME